MGLHLPRSSSLLMIMWQVAWCYADLLDLSNSIGRLACLCLVLGWSDLATVIVIAVIVVMFVTSGDAGQV